MRFSEADHLLRWIRLRLSRLRHRSPPTQRPLPAALRIVGGLAFLVVIGTLLLMLPGMGAERPLTLMEALFTATSALSVTGLSIITPSLDLSLLGQLTLLLLIQIGGIGFMMIAVTFFLLLGRKVNLLDRIALSNALGLLTPGGIIRLTQRVALAVLMFEAVGAVLLYIHWREQLGDQRALLYAVFHSVSAFCNAGFDLFSGQPDYPAGLPNDTISLLILGSLIFIGGLGIPVLADLFTWSRTQRLSLQTRITLVVTVILHCAGGLGMFLSERGVGRLLADETWPRQLLLAFFQSISARTAGFSGLQPFEQIAPATQMLLMPLMLIGASPASMGGGMTTGTFAVLGIALWGYARGHSQAHVGGRSIATSSIQKAGAVLTISLFVVTFATWLILMTNDVPLNQAMFEVFSAFATCGLSLGLTSELNTVGRLIIVLIMFWGRLGALTIVVALAAQSNTRRELVSYPEEPVLIG